LAPMRRTLRYPLTPVALAAAVVGALLALGETSFGLAAAPTLLLLASLLTGRLPGERLLSDLAARVRDARRQPRGARRQPRPVLARSHGPRGGLLIAASLSSRGPPPPA
jgi:hypothetical protein